MHVAGVALVTYAAGFQKTLALAGVEAVEGLVMVLQSRLNVRVWVEAAVALRRRTGRNSVNGVVMNTT